MTDSTQFDLPSSLSVDLHNDIAVLSLSRPEKRNAIDFPMIRGLDRFFSELPDSIRAVVIHGKGDHFSAGLDLSSISDIDSSAVLFGSQAWHRVFDRIEHGNVPVIAVPLSAADSNWQRQRTSELPSAGLSTLCRRAVAVSSSAAALRCGYHSSSASPEWWT